MNRGFDIVAAGAGVILLGPLLLAIGLAVALADGFPVVFRQTRVGRNGARFSLLKFRSMRTGVAGARITADEDCRVTALGRVLRRYKLDELPQLWNVLRGDMSVIGPRPEVPAFVDLESPVWREVLSVRPGITDLASLMYRDEERLLAGSADTEARYREVILPDKLALNIVYLRTRSFVRDLRIILLTAASSLFPRTFDARRVRHCLFEIQTL